MSRLDSACDAIDLVAATVDTLAGIVENDVFGVEFVDRCASPLRIVFTEDVVKIAGQQGRYAVGHGCCFSSLERVPLALMYPTTRRNGEDSSMQPSQTLLHQCGGALADYPKGRFAATKLLLAQFREHSLHLQGMLSKG